MEIFCNIINVFVVIFDHFNASFLNENINFLKKIILTSDLKTKL